jgi:hypothetical protein
MTKPTKTMIAYSELNASDQRLAAKLISTLGKSKLDATNRKAVSRALIRSTRGPDAASPQAKKKFRNGFTVFYGERYPVIRKGQGKNMDITEIAKLVGKEWRELDEKDKQKFKQQAKESRA